MADFAECASHDDRHDQRSFGGQAQFTQTLGDTQRRLLRVLQIDGRTANAELARRSLLPTQATQRLLSRQIVAGSASAIR